jgi:Fur family transcriptional regulator, iron response regulator
VRPSCVNGVTAVTLPPGLKPGAKARYIQLMTSTDHSIAWLERGGLRPTRQRLALAELLVGDGQNRHVTAESLYAASVQAGEKVSLATVYNTLRAFCGAGLMNEVVVDGSKSYFDTRMDDHPHFYWEDTASLTDAPAQLQITGLPDAPAGTEISKVDVVIRLRRA